MYTPINLSAFFHLSLRWNYCSILISLLYLNIYGLNNRLTNLKINPSLLAKFILRLEYQSFKLTPLKLRSKIF